MPVHPYSGDDDRRPVGHVKLATARSEERRMLTEMLERARGLRQFIRG